MIKTIYISEMEGVNDAYIAKDPKGNVLCTLIRDYVGPTLEQEFRNQLKKKFVAVKDVIEEAEIIFED